MSLNQIEGFEFEYGDGGRSFTLAEGEKVVYESDEYPSWKETQAALLAKAKELRYGIQHDAAQRFIERVYGYVSGSTHNEWPGLVLSENGMARLAAIRGWMLGLWHGGQEELVVKLFRDLNQQLSYLAAYGGTGEMQCENNGGTVETRRFRIVLSDDGTLHGFSITGFRRVTNAERIDRAQEIFNVWNEADPLPNGGKGADGMHSSTFHARWDEAVKEAEKVLRINRSLDTQVSYFPIWDKEQRHYTIETVFWGYSWNGAMVYRGPGAGQTFCVNVGSDALWTIHT